MILEFLQELAKNGAKRFLAVIKRFLAKEPADSSGFGVMGNRTQLASAQLRSETREDRMWITPHKT